jgi:very-short-patch-repair endonuclease
MSSGPRAGAGLGAPPPPERGRHRRPSAAVLSAKNADAKHRLWVGVTTQGAGVVHGPRFDRTKIKIERSRRLRRDATDVERRLWQKLRNAQIDGASFRRQHPAGNYILDFYCPALQLAIELDGGQHAQATSRDRQRDEWLSTRGVTMLRFWNSDVTQNLNGVLEVIALKIAELKLQAPHPTRRWRDGGVRR